MAKAKAKTHEAHSANEPTMEKRGTDIKYQCHNCSPMVTLMQTEISMKYV